MTRFLLIRHAATDALGVRLSGRHEGVPLNTLGGTQAAMLAERLGHLPITAVYTSPLERARATASALAAKLGLPAIADDAFLELDFGEWTNREFTQLAPDPVFGRFNSFRSCSRIPGGESMAEAQIRFVNGLQRLALAHPHQAIAIVSHSDMIKAALGFFAGIPIDLVQRLEISPASVSIIELFEDTVRIMGMNDTGSCSFG